MKTIKFFLLAGIVLFFSSCYEEENVPLDELDVTLTKYDTEFNFTTYSTFALPDSTALKSNYLDEDAIEEFYAEGGASEIILDAVKSKFTELGYSQVSAGASPDFVAVPTVLMVRRTNAVYFPPGWWWGYPGWGWRPGWRWPWFPRYPWHPGYVSYYSYREGSLVIEMVDGNSLRNAVQHATNNPGDPNSGDDLPEVTVRWMANIDGYLSNNGDYNVDRATRGFNEAFDQSPYLKKN